jgi:lipoyl(octanoyl) transferase
MNELRADPHDTAWLGRQPYGPMWTRLRDRAAAIAAGVEDECIWSCTHDPVYTTGMRGRDNRIVDTLPAPMVRTDRGGETTFHGPGQIMLYPLIHLRARRLGARRYVEILEESCLRTLAGLGVAAHRRCGFPGIWTGQGKIAALGIRIGQGVAYHGMALNVRVDPGWFACIRPCGLAQPIDILDHYGFSLPDDRDLAMHWAGELASLLR